MSRMPDCGSLTVAVTVTGPLGFAQFATEQVTPPVGGFGSTLKPMLVVGEVMPALSVDVIPNDGPLLSCGAQAMSALVPFGEIGHPGNCDRLAGHDTLAMPDSGSSFAGTCIVI